MTSLPQRIAFCITELNPGGAEKALVRIAASLDRNEWEPVVYCLAPRGPLADQLEASRVRVVCLNARSRWDLRVLFRLARELRKVRPVILQTFLFHANIMGRLAATMAGVPVVVSGVRVVEPDARWRHRVDAWTNRLVTHNVCVSEGVASVCRQFGMPSQKISVISNGVDAMEMAQAIPVPLEPFGVPPSAVVIMTVGRLHPQKGIVNLIEASEPLFRSFESLHLVIVGEGPQRQELADMIGAHELGERIHLLGWRPDVSGLLKSADIFVLPSLWEGMPNALLEAMAAGLPVVATNVEGVREVVRDGESGLIVPPQSIDRLRAALRTLLTSPELRRSLGRAAQSSSTEGFTWDSACRSYASLYQRLLKTTH